MPADVVLPPPVVNGVGTFTPPGATPPEPAPLIDAGTEERDRLLLEHKLLGTQLATIKAKRADIEARMATLDAKKSLAMKLAGMTPAERQLLEDTLAEAAQRRIDADKAAATEPPA